MAKGYLSEIFTSIQGEGPYVGFKQIFVRFTGCTLHCDFCDTKEAWEVSPNIRIFNSSKYDLLDVYSNPITPEDTLDLIQKIISREVGVHSIFLTGGEPLEQPEYFQGLVILLKKSGFKVYLETNTVNFQNLKKVIEFIDIISADVKIVHPEFESALSGSFFEFLLLTGEVEVFLKIPVNSGLNLSFFKSTIKKINSIRKDVPIIIQPLTDELLPEPDKKLIEMLFELQNYTSRYFDQVRIVPQIHKFLRIK